MPVSPAAFLPGRLDGAAPLKPTLSGKVRLGLLASVIFFHVGGGWALTLIHPKPLVVGETASMEVRMVPAAMPSPPQPEAPPPEDPPPPEPQPQLESMIQPPPPDLPPPVFPVPVKPPPPPPKPHRPPPAPRPTEVPTQPSPQTAPPAPPAGPKTVTASQVGYLDPPQPVYPARSRRAGEKGTVLVKVFIDPTGRPAQVALQSSSGHPALDESAMSAVRAARFRPYSEAGLPQAVWVVIPIKFVLQ